MLKLIHIVLCGIWVTRRENGRNGKTIMTSICLCTGWCREEPPQRNGSGAVRCSTVPVRERRAAGRSASWCVPPASCRSLGPGEQLYHNVRVGFGRLQIWDSPHGHYRRAPPLGTVRINDASQRAG